MKSRLRRSKHTPAARGSHWIRPSTRWAIYYRDGFTCAYCGRSSEWEWQSLQDMPQLDIMRRQLLSLDHVRAVTHGARDNAPSNLTTCCVSCNSSKQGLTMRQWLARLRSFGIDTELVRRRIRNLCRKAIDREVGRRLARRDVNE